MDFLDLEVNFESVKTESDSKIWKIRAISETITGNKRQYTESELSVSARSLSFRPLNFNHDHNEWIQPFKEGDDYKNATLVMDYDESQKAVVGLMRISDPKVNEMIGSGKIRKLSIEQTPYQGESCDSSKCTQKGIIFTALALLTEGVKAGDESTWIKSLNERLEKNESDIKELKECKEKLEQKQENSSEKSETDCPCKDMETSTTESKTGETKTESTVTQDTQTESKPAIQTLSAQDFQKILVSVEKQNSESLKVFAEKLDLIVKAISSNKEEKASSEVVDTTKKSYFESCIQTPNQWFSDIRQEKTGTTDYFSWNVPKEEILGQLTNSPTPKAVGNRFESISITAGDKPITFDKRILIMPNGEMVYSIRPYLDVQVVENARTYQWWVGDGFDVDDTTAEGSEPTNESQTLTKKTATPSIKRSVQTVNIGDIEETNFDLIDYFNRCAIKGSVNVENKAILNTLLDAVTPDGTDNTKMAWINANTGADLSAGGSDDVNGMTFGTKALTASLAILAKRGFNVSRGNVVAFLHPIAIQQLADAIGSDYFTTDVSLSTNDITSLIERRFGIEIVPANAVKAKTNSNYNTYRNYIMVKGVIGLGVGSNLLLEAQKKVELSAIKVSARHKIAGAILLEGGIVRVSSKQ